MVTKGERGGRGINQEFEIKIYTLLYVKYIKQITNKNLLYIAQGTLLNISTYKGEKNLKKNGYTIYITESSAEHLKQTQYCK